jgi:ethanolamine utilization microcompartment shell protein EutS
MNDLPDPERTLALDFLRPYFPNQAPDADVAVSAHEEAVIDEILAYVDERFGRMKYVLGLALDFTLLAQRLTLIDPQARHFRPELTAEALFVRYPRVTERGRTAANTLTVTFEGREEGIRRIEEQVRRLFYQLARPGYPSSYVYATGQWTKYQDLLALCFSLSEPARLLTARRLLDYGLNNLPANTFIGRTQARVRLFEGIVTRYSRRPQRRIRENAGLAFQAMAYGFITADRGHLEIIASGVRTGSARQLRIGDIDGYHGLDLELSVEVKAIRIDVSNVGRELSQFANNIRRFGILGLALVVDVDEATRHTWAEDGVIVITEAEMLKTVGTWDWPKQDAAVHGMLHYLAHIEQNVHAVQRLLAFIAEADPSHDSLAYFRTEEGEPSGGDVSKA